MTKLPCCHDEIDDFLNVIMWKLLAYSCSLLQREIVMLEKVGEPSWTGTEFIISSNLCKLKCLALDIAASYAKVLSSQVINSFS